MKTISKLQRKAVRLKWRELADNVEIYDSSGRLLREPTFEEMVGIGMGRGESRRNGRLIMAMRVLRVFQPPLELNTAAWAVRHGELRAVRDEQLEDWCDDQVEAETDAMWEAHLEETRKRPELV